MGILNVTPDSFFDGGKFHNVELAIERGIEMIEQGADIIDVGGESTRPGAAEVSVEDEMNRVIEVVSNLASHVRVSIDTTKPEIAVAASNAGATIINDVSAALDEIAAELGVSWVAMHMRGRPRTMQSFTDYQDLFGEVSDFLMAASDRARSRGISEVWVDPGIGFGKLPDHNIRVLQALPRLVALGFPTLLGTSRKSTIGKLTGRDAHERAYGTAATVALGIAAGIDIVRVHDVEEIRDVVRVSDAIERDWRPDSWT